MITMPDTTIDSYVVPESNTMTARAIIRRIMKSGSIFKNREILQDTWIPETMPGRCDEMEKISEFFKHPIKTDNSSGTEMLIQGPSGTGKTCIVKLVINEMKAILEEDGYDDFIIVHFDSHQVQTLNEMYAFIANVLYTENEKVRKAVADEVIDTTLLSFYNGYIRSGKGTSTTPILTFVRDVIKKFKFKMVIVADEADKLTKKKDIGDDWIFSLLEARKLLGSTKHLSIICIVNDVLYLNKLSPHVRSRFTPDELVFNRYDAEQITNILLARVPMAFQENTIKTGVVSRIAALTARESGDARQALDILMKSGEHADRVGKTNVDYDDIDQAYISHEYAQIRTAVIRKPLQSRILIEAILGVQKEMKQAGIKEPKIKTSQIFDAYKSVCEERKETVLSRRWIHLLLSELSDECFLDVCGEVYDKQDNIKVKKYWICMDLDAVQEALNLADGQ